MTNKGLIEATNGMDLVLPLISAVAVTVLVFDSSASKVNAILGIFHQEVKGQCLARRDPCLGGEGAAQLLCFSCLLNLSPRPSSAPSRTFPHILTSSVPFWGDFQRVLGGES